MNQHFSSFFFHIVVVGLLALEGRPLEANVVALFATAAAAGPLRNRLLTHTV